MSEPSSLYAKIFISKEARQLFLGSKINGPSNYNDWLPWLASRKYHGSGITQANIDHIEYAADSSGAYLRAWLDEPRSFGHEFFDEEHEVWLLSMYEFSENYLEYINFLNVLRGIDGFTDKERQSFILVHDYIWGDTDSDVLIKVSKGSSHIVNSVDDIPAAYINEASEYFKQREAQIAQQYNN